MMEEVDEQKESLSIENRLVQSCTPSNFPKSAGKTKVRNRVIDTSAKKAQVSTTTYRKTNEIIEQNPPEELLNKLRLGKVSIPKAYRQLENQKKRQELLSNGVISNIQFSDNIQLILGDFIEICKDIPDNSIDLIFTDPPYDSRWLPLYESLGKIAFRVLKEGGSLVMYVGHYASPQIFDYMENTGLKYWWPIVVKHPDSSAKMFSKKVSVTYKPLLWYVKGPEPKILEFIEDSVESHRPDKTLHPWTSQQMRQSMSYPN